MSPINACETPQRRGASLVFVTALFVACAWTVDLAAGETRGQVVEVSGHSARIKLATTDGVKVGDRVEIVEVLAEIGDEAQVASGAVTKVEAGSVWMSIGEASGKVAAGQQARVVPRPRPRTASRVVSQPVSPPEPQPVSQPVKQSVSQRTSEE